MSLIICTPGGSTDNSYLSLAEADEYFADTLREATWQSWAETDRERAVIQATAEIERLGGDRLKADNPTRVLFAGQALRFTQALHFPRFQDVDREGSSYVPAGVKEAVCEQAIWLLQQRDNPELVDRETLQAAGVRRLSLDGLTETYGPRRTPPGIAPRAWQAVRAYRKQVFRTRG